MRNTGPDFQSPSVFRSVGVTAVPFGATLLAKRECHPEPFAKHCKRARIQHPGRGMPWGKRHTGTTRWRIGPNGPATYRRKAVSPIPLLKTESDQWCRFQGEMFPGFTAAVGRLTERHWRCEKPSAGARGCRIRPCGLVRIVHGQAVRSPFGATTPRCPVRRRWPFRTAAPRLGRREPLARMRRNASLQDSVRCRSAFARDGGSACKPGGPARRNRQSGRGQPPVRRSSPPSVRLPSPPDAVRMAVRLRPVTPKGVVAEVAS